MGLSLSPNLELYEHIYKHQRIFSILAQKVKTNFSLTPEEIKELRNEVLTHDSDKLIQPQLEGQMLRYSCYAKPELKDQLTNNDKLKIKKSIILHISINRHHFDYHRINKETDLDKHYILNENLLDVEAKEPLIVNPDRFSLLLAAIDSVSVTIQRNQSINQFIEWTQKTFDNRYKLDKNKLEEFIDYAKYIINL